jgi:nucleotide-binding universal stress UspA family protein
VTASGRPATIVAVVNEEGSDPVRRRAIDLARETGAGLILWDADAGTRLLEDPLPNQWSAHGEEEQFGDRLTVNDLEAAGRAPLARQVAEAQAAGVQAWGWLPADQDAETLREYAERQGARAIVVGADSHVGSRLGDDGIPVEVVGPSD